MKKYILIEKTENGLLNIKPLNLQDDAEVPVGAFSQQEWFNKLEALGVIEVVNDEIIQNDELVSHLDLVDGEIVLKDSEILANAKQNKIKEIKKLCDDNLNMKVPKTGSNFVCTIDGTPREFLIKKEDVAILKSVIDSFELLEVGAKKGWTDINGERVLMEKNDFKSLLNHYIERDQSEHDLRQKRINAVNALTTLDEVKNYDINTVYE